MLIAYWQIFLLLKAILLERSAATATITTGFNSILFDPFMHNFEKWPNII